MNKHAIRAFAASSLVVGCAVLGSATSTVACTSEPAAEAPLGPIAFAAEEGGEGATVFLRRSPALGNGLVFDVVARGPADLHGAAFRLHYDPEAMTFVSAGAGPSWSKTAIALAKEGAPGQLAVTWSEKGEAGIDTTHETVLGTVAFEVRGRKPSPVSFKVERSTLVDRKGARIAASWRGGTLAPR